MEQILNNNFSIVKNSPTENMSPQELVPVGRRIFNNRELLETFPEAKKTLKALVKEDKQLLAEMYAEKERTYNRLYSKLKMSEVEFATNLIMSVIGMNIIRLNDIIVWDNEKGNRGVTVIKNNSGFNRVLKVEDRLERNERLLRLYDIMSNKTCDDDFQIRKERAKTVPIGSLIKLDSRGKAKCPFHNETEASFNVNIKKNLWHCFGGCGGGDVISFVMKMDNCNFIEAVNKLS